MQTLCLGCNESKKHWAKGCCYKCYHKQYNYHKKKDFWKKTCSVCLKPYFSKGSVSRAKYCKECAVKVELDKRRLRNRLRKGIPLDRPVGFKRKANTGTITPQGYKIITNHGHPNANTQGKMPEHSAIMSEYLGRPLRKGESVHHKNGLRADNRIENLELWHKGQPAGQRLNEKIEWAKKFLEEYGYNVIGGNF